MTRILRTDSGDLVRVVSDSDTGEIRVFDSHGVLLGHVASYAF